MFCFIFGKCKSSQGFFGLKMKIIINRGIVLNVREYATINSLILGTLNKDSITI